MRIHTLIQWSCCLLAIAVVFAACSKEQERNEDLIPIPNTVQFEQRLSAYNIYNGEPENLLPTADYELLELNAKLFSNYSKKQRLVKVPAGKQLQEDGNGSPNFPDGTILVKTFFYYLDERDESLGKQIVETRLLIKSHGEWNVGTYVWNQDQTDATLELDGFDKVVTWTNEIGDQRSIFYHYPNQTECISCHQRNEQVVTLGPSLRNLNIDVKREEITGNQLDHLQSVGVLESFDAGRISDIPDYDDLSASLADRGRSYLDMNCAHCHNPDAWSKPANKGLDLRFETPLAGTGILDKQDRIKSLMQSGEMPFLGNTVVHDEGVALVVEYINSL